jgi:circadian clock protein KaiB
VTDRNLPERQTSASAPEISNKEDGVRFRLYLAGSTPNSRRAESNLDEALREFTGRDFGVEYIDVLLDAKRAATDGVIVTPTLIAIGRKSRLVIIGDLSDSKKLHAFLKATASFDQSVVSKPAISLVEADMETRSPID